MYPMGYTSTMLVQVTEVYREWIINLKDRADRARSRCVSTGWCTAIGPVQDAD